MLQRSCLFSNQLLFNLFSNIFIPNFSHLCLLNHLNELSLIYSHSWWWIWTFSSLFPLNKAFLPFIRSKKVLKVKNVFLSYQFQRPMNVTFLIKKNEISRVSAAFRQNRVDIISTRRLKLVETSLLVISYLNEYWHSKIFACSLFSFSLNNSVTKNNAVQIRGSKPQRWHSEVILQKKRYQWINKILPTASFKKINHPTDSIIFMLTHIQIPSPYEIPKAQPKNPLLNMLTQNSLHSTPIFPKIYIS